MGHRSISSAPFSFQFKEFGMFVNDDNAKEYVIESLKNCECLKNSEAFKEFFDECFNQFVERMFDQENHDEVKICAEVTDDMVLKFWEAAESELLDWTQDNVINKMLTKFKV